MADELASPAAAVRWVADMQNHGFTSSLFKSIVVTHGLKVLIEHELPDPRVQMRPDSIRGTTLFWSEHDHSRSMLLRASESDAVALVHQRRSSVNVMVAGNDRDGARKLIELIDQSLPREEKKEETSLPITFWHVSIDGADTLNRQIELTRWSDIASNYVGDTQARLARLMEGFRPKQTDGRLLLWHGEPGTGKTFAIRALAWAWREWCRFEYVIDPEELFQRGTYLTEVMLYDGTQYPEQERDDRWRLLIVEDSGEMMAMDAKSQIGQGLSRLLNLSDGILGQGTKILILVTTNEDLGQLNPAITRHGRCLSEIGFRRFDVEEARKWLHAAGYDQRINAAHTLSELYALAGGDTRDASRPAIGFRAPDRNGRAID